MPELPEVETIVRGLKRTILGRKIEDVWSDTPKIVKKPASFAQFKKEIKGRKIEKVWRRGKNILFLLSGKKVLLIHQKMTGHLLLGKWEKKGKSWQSLLPGPLKDDPMNRFLHLIFWLDNGKQLALSDLRKFAKAELREEEELNKAKDFKSLGPEPLARDFSFIKFRQALKGKKGKIKQVLMNQEVIAGVGNIYSDEALWRARIHPLKDVSGLKEEELKKLYRALRVVLKQAIRLQGESISDFRTLSGEKGRFDILRKVYRRQGEKCPRCKSIIKRVKVGGRSAHFCPKCQPT